MTALKPSSTVPGTLRNLEQKPSNLIGNWVVAELCVSAISLPRDFSRCRCNVESELSAARSASVVRLRHQAQVRVGISPHRFVPGGGDRAKRTLRYPTKRLMRLLRPARSTLRLT